MAVPLNESGTGISQVLSILYVVLTAERPQTIVIDEPQSFLHPGAARKLIEVLKQHSMHQFILTTHSANVINAAEPERIILLRKTENQTRASHVDPNQSDDLRMMLYELGVRLADVFGADNILWVEGDTEERCFPLIFSELLETPLYGTQVMSVARTGDFEGKHVDLVLEIYERLSSGPSLLPPALGFMFDRENRSEEKQRDLERQGKGRVVLTTRRMYENYLLVPAAIASVASAIEGFRARSPLTAEEVERWFEEHRWDRTYFGRAVPRAERTEQSWLADVNGAAVLRDIFDHFSEHRVVYDKVRHSVELTKWMLTNKPSELREFADAAERLRALPGPTNPPSAGASPPPASG